MKRLKFDELQLSDGIIQAVTEMGFEEASPIQTEAIPYLLAGNDIIGHAQTGTGKTAAFAIPIIEKLDMDSSAIQAIVMCPTRELVIQVTDEFRRLMKYKDNVSVTPVYGGQEIERQFKALRKNPQIIIGTPGRTIDHIKRGTVKLDKVSFVVLDEADEMLDMGFREDIELILERTPNSRQLAMFSATMPDEITKLMKRHQNNPKFINVTHHKLSSPKIEQIYFEIQEKLKPEALARLIDYHNVKLALVFCNTKIRVDELVDNLKSRGYFAEGLHGDMSQSQREKVMGSFRSGIVEILVATDVAGRGIDVNDIEAVFNYDLPSDDEDYLHRIGRTGRAGKSGMAFTFVVGKQIYNLKRIEKTNDSKIIRKQIPSLDDLDETRLKSFKTKIKGMIDKGHLTKYVNLIDKLLADDYVALDIAAALLKISLDQKNKGFDDSLSFDNIGYFDNRKFTETKSDYNRKKRRNGNSYETRREVETAVFGRYRDEKSKKTSDIKRKKKKHAKAF
ncbi:MAG: ATP-dependent helicase DeaD [Bacteroidota bacterium]|nr:ATP-dependent helicase DeaD [Bacteroidota bacterium]